VCAGFGSCAQARDAIAAAAALDKTVRSRCLLGFFAVRYRCRLALGCRGEHSCCGGSSAQLRAARSDLTWRCQRPTDEGLASAASEPEEEGVDSGQVTSGYKHGEVWRHWLTKKRPPTRASRAERARSESAGVLEKISESTTMQKVAVHSPNRRGLTTLGHCERPQTRVLRAGPESAGVHSAQVSSG
ncbi:hypothetical protein TYRP_022017, partial [Tyrophagus putrescentiae]